MRLENFFEAFPFTQVIVFLERTLVEAGALDVGALEEAVGVGVGVEVGVGVTVGRGSGVPPVTVTDTGADANPLATTRTEDTPSVISDGS